ncbi:hypothetical protein HELRODRAFT_111611, partial [Helobdella robusta]|uniref:Uncharacterized protein n=1 Tax=Helobdella robusta TaxID=6412 RepID=T1EFC8_HELRO
MAETNKGEKDEKMRVKLYMLNAGRVWDDQGTGYVSSTFIDKSKNMILLVKEENKNTVLLESKIQLNTAYQKQQETLIVWSEADNYDYALSFQNKAGCDEIWAQICQVQGKDPSVDITQDILLDQDDPDLDDDRFDVSGGAGHLGHHDDVVDRVSMSLPSCELGRLDDIVELFQSCLTSPIKRERLATLLESENYIGKLVELFRMSEDLEDIDALHKLFNAFKSLFFLNKTPVFEAMFADDVIFDVIGALEYDPAHQQQQQQQPQPIKHREYLKTQTRLKQAVPIENPELIQKIHQTYRVQYIQDAILPAPSVFEDNVLSTLTSFIYFNKMEIVTVLQEDEKYLQTLFKQLVDDDTDDDARKDMVIFLKEFCSFSQNLAQQNREGFFKALSKLGILNTVETILGLDDPTIRSYAIDIFSYIVEFSPSLVREFCMQESLKHEDDELLINIVIEQMFVDHDPEMGGALQLMGIIRLLIDPENMTTAIKNEKTEFLAFFYPHCMHVLTAPLYANTAEGKPSRDDYQTAQLLAHILELLTFCVEHHAYHIKNHINNVNILKRVLTLLKSKHAFLQLSSLRLLRRMIGLKDEFYVKHIVKYDLLKTVVEAFKRNGHRYNLFDSAVIELFEFIRTEDIKPVIAYFVPCHFASVEDVKYVQTFQLLKQKYDQSLERVNSAPSTTAASTTAAANVSVSGSNVNFLSPLNSSMTSSTAHTSKAEQSQMDDDEETWFDQDD